MASRAAVWQARPECCALCWPDQLPDPQLESRLHQSVRFHRHSPDQQTIPPPSSLSHFFAHESLVPHSLPRIDSELRCCPFVTAFSPMHAFAFSVRIRAVLTAEYAVRGELVLRAAAIKQGGFKETPYEKLLECNSTPRGLFKPTSRPFKSSRTCPLAVCRPCGRALPFLVPIHLAHESSALTSRVRRTAAVGNPQAVGQQPLSFGRQVLSLMCCPALLEQPGVDQLFAVDAIARAREYLSAIPNGIGAYSESQGFPSERPSPSFFGASGLSERAAATRCSSWRQISSDLVGTHRQAHMPTRACFGASLSVVSVSYSPVSLPHLLPFSPPPTSSRPLQSCGSRWQTSSQLVTAVTALTRRTSFSPTGRPRESVRSRAPLESEPGPSPPGCNK